MFEYFSEPTCIYNQREATSKIKGGSQRALEEIETLENRHWIIYSDSQSALLAIKTYKPKHPIVQSIQEIIYRNAEKRITMCKVPSHVNVQGNELADKAAKMACEINPVTSNRVPLIDLNGYIKAHFREEWQLQWNNAEDKLQKIKPNIESWPNIPNRRESVILTRLRIGHTRLTHSYYMTRGRPPECCGTQLTVDHLLTKCEKLKELRTKYELPNDLKVLLGRDCPKDRIIRYLSEAKLKDDI